MKTAYIMMLGALFSSGLISFFTGRVLWGVLVPTLVAGFFVSIGAIKNPSSFLGLFFMAAIPYSVISLTGASIGKWLSQKREEENQDDSSTSSR